MLQGPAQPIHDRSDVAGVNIAASASARRSDWWYPHEVALDQLQRIQVGNSRAAHSKLLSPRIDRILDFT